MSGANNIWANVAFLCICVSAGVTVGLGFRQTMRDGCQACSAILVCVGLIATFWTIAFMPLTLP